MSSLAERLFGALSRAGALIVGAVPVAVVALLVWQAASLSLGLLARPNNFGKDDLLLTALFTLAVSAAAAAVGGTAGIGCAIAAEELAPGAVRAVLLTAIGFLGSMPAVVFGWFAAAIVAPLAAAHPFGGASRFAAATLVLSAMVAPIACGLVSRALRRIPDSVRHAAAAAGATRLQTTLLVVVPGFIRRIFAASVAAFARAVGEATAMQVLFAVLAPLGLQGVPTTAAWIFSTTPGTITSAWVSTGALALVAVTALCGVVVAREYRGMQWA